MDSLFTRSGAGAALARNGIAANREHTVFLENFPECGPSPVQQNPGIFLGYLQLHGDFPVGQTSHIVKRHDFVLGIWKVKEMLGNTVPHLFFEHSGLGVFVFTLNMTQNLLIGCRVRTPARSTKMVPHKVKRDGAEPTARAGLPPVALPGARGAKKRLLHQVVGQRHVPD